MGGLITGLKNNLINHKIQRMLLFLLPRDTDMNFEKLKAMPTADLLDLYNDLEQQNVKRMKNRAETERRTIEALKKKGKWEEDAAVPYSPAQVEPGDNPGESPIIPNTKGKRGVSGIKKGEASSEQLAGNGAGDANPKGSAPAAAEKLKKGKAGGKGKAAAAETDSNKPLTAKEKAARRAALGAETKDEPAAKGKKAAGGKKQSAATKQVKADKKKRGAPVKNQTFTLVPEKDKKRNPKGLKIQPNSARNVVLLHLQTKKGPQTREQIEKAFEGTDTNVGSSLYFLVKHHFLTVEDNG